MKLSCISDQINQDIFVACRVLKENNLSNIEIHAVNHKTIEVFSEKDLIDIESAIKKYDMEVVALSATIFMMVPLYSEDQITDFHPDFYKVHGEISDHFHFLEKTFKLANRLNCPTVRIFPFRAPNNRIVIGGKRDQEEMIQYFAKAAKMANAHNIVLAVENCPYSHLPKGNMVYDAVQAIDSPNLRILYDPGNSYRANKDRVPPQYLNMNILDELKLIYPYIQHVHIKDYKYVVGATKPFKHVVIGDGDVPIKEIIAYLKRQGYKKGLSCEPELSYHKTLESLESIKKIYEIV